MEPRVQGHLCGSILPGYIESSSSDGLICIAGTVGLIESSGIDTSFGDASGCTGGVCPREHPAKKSPKAMIATILYFIEFLLSV